MSGKPISLLFLKNGRNLTRPAASPCLSLSTPSLILIKINAYWLSIICDIFGLFTNSTATNNTMIIVYQEISWPKKFVRAIPCPLVTINEKTQYVRKIDLLPTPPPSSLTQKS